MNRGICHTLGLHLVTQIINQCHLCVKWRRVVSEKRCEYHFILEVS